MTVNISEVGTSPLKNTYLVHIILKGVNPNHISTLITSTKFHNPQSLSTMKVSGIVNTPIVLQCPLVAQDEWYPTGYARHLIILEEKGANDSDPKSTSVTLTKDSYVTAPKADSVKAPKAKFVKTPKAKVVKAPKSKKVFHV